MIQNLTVNLSALCNSCAKVSCCSSQLISRVFMQLAASKMQASSSSGVSTFALSTSLFIQPINQKSSEDSNSFISGIIQN